MGDISIIGVDLGKGVINICGMTQRGRVVSRKRLNRVDFLWYMQEQERCLVGMEACAGSHYWGRELEKLGFNVKLMPPQYVKPYVKTNKNDANDAEACAEAVNRPTMRFVKVKNEFQQELNQLHRVRERLVGNRTALLNEIRGFLYEFGIVIAQGVAKFRLRVLEALESKGSQLPVLSQSMLKRLLEEFSRLEEEIIYYEKELKAINNSHPSCQRLNTIPGVGALSATAIIGAISNIEEFKNGRQLSAFLGLVPRQNSTGGKERLGKISKRGDVYIRKLLVQGAHSVLRHVGEKKDRRSLWLKEIRERRGPCRAAVALANKNARVIWALLAHDDVYQAKRRRVKRIDKEIHENCVC